MKLIAKKEVLTGPFKGMQYLDKAVGSSYYPKLLGCYEKELAPTIEKLPKFGFQQIVDVGAAEGYYAIGLARLLNIPVLAFEACDPKPLTDLIKINNVEAMVTANTYCDLGRLQNALEKNGRKLLVMDIEGSEITLLDPIFLPELRNTAILVETHDFIIQGATDVITERFKDSHNIESIPYKPRKPEDFPVPIKKFPFFDHRFYLVEFLNERPPGTQWLWMVPKAFEQH